MEQTDIAPDDKLGIIRVELGDTQKESTPETLKEISNLLDYMDASFGTDDDHIHRDIATLRHYYCTLTPEKRAELAEKLKGSDVHQGVANRLFIIYMNACAEPMRDNNGNLRIRGGTPRFSDIIGYMSCYHGGESDGFIRFVQVFIAQAHRQKGIAKNALRQVAHDLQNESTASLPLFVVDVPLSVPALRLFLSCGFQLSRDPETLPQAPLSFVEGLALGEKMGKALVAHKENATDFPFGEYESLFLLDGIPAYRMILIPYLCHACKKRDVPLQRCTRCNAALYCSIECQKVARRAHKRYCFAGRA